MVVGNEAEVGEEKKGEEDEVARCNTTSRCCTVRSKGATLVQTKVLLSRLIIVYHNW